MVIDPRRSCLPTNGRSPFPASSPCAIVQPAVSPLALDLHAIPVFVLWREEALAFRFLLASHENVKDHKAMATWPGIGSERVRATTARRGRKCCQRGPGNAVQVTIETTIAKGVQTGPASHRASLPPGVSRVLTLLAFQPLTTALWREKCDGLDRSAVYRRQWVAVAVEDAVSGTAGLEPNTSMPRKDHLDARVFHRFSIWELPISVDNDGRHVLGSPASRNCQDMYVYEEWMEGRWV